MHHANRTAQSYGSRLSQRQEQILMNHQHYFLDISPSQLYLPAKWGTHTHTHTHTHLCICVCMYVHLYAHTQQGQGERQWTED